ncbi:putative sigma E factor negative regulatory protein ResB [Burkholderia mallei PRL-20]|uniref:Sigma factor algU regulatory protein MucB n=1 Tax=Burkholderia mallei (strain NCTC 10229) TaxID=412022 RepID=A2S9Z0_BURM9|nr:sigma factor algU regulatory protein MucB [Burkholderia mallei SAVP1]ABN03730.1 sigma factor algU regulatory protein MucB [Burkholderia mallei NCTC 10229]ABO03939.1 sigma factor algU regulatory protein MucB [Burkholderia mallei NCTC 10247]EES45510.1 putative sigma E factor negative regulatory protein ResB [Burkholderia mallei PRL-20]
MQLNQAILGWRRLPALLLCAAALLSAQPRAFAQPDDPVATRRQAAEWLDRIQQAAQQQNYEGTFVYQRGTYVQSSRIVHVATKGDGEYERVESLDGKPRKLLRHNDDLYTFVPERRLCVVERRQNKDSFPALLGASGEQVLSVYEPKSLGRDRVAGLDAQVVELVPKDAYRFAYKLWTDAKTGLLLRSQTLDTDDRVLEQIAFSQLQLGAAAPSQKTAIAAGMRNLGGWTVVRPPVAPVDIEAQGWQIAPTVAGFRKIREVRRPMAARDANDPPIAVDQAVFTDGLATISVFIEPAEKNSRKEGAGGTGATHVLVKRRGDFWITVLGEAPPSTLQQFASAIEYKASK